MARNECFRNPIAATIGIGWARRGHSNSDNGGKTIKRHLKLANANVIAALVLPYAAVAQATPEAVRSMVAPDAVQTHIGTLQFSDGAPTAEIAARVYDRPDFRCP